MLLLEFHKWCGFGTDRDLFLITVRCGFFAVSVNSQRVTDIIREYREKLDELRRKLKQDDDGQGSNRDRD